MQGYLTNEAIQLILEAQGASPVPSSLEKKGWYGKLMIRHILVDSTRFLLDDLKKGLQTLDGLEAMQANPEQFCAMGILVVGGGLGKTSLDSHYSRRWLGKTSWVSHFF